MSAAAHHSDDCLLARPLRWATTLLIGRPWLAAGLLLAVTIAAGIYTAAALGFHTSRLHLLNPESDFNRRWLAYLDEFGDADDVVMVVRGPHREAVEPILDRVAERLAQEPQHFARIMHRVDLSTIRAKGLYYLAPDELQQIHGFLDRIGPILANDWSMLNLGNLLGGTAYQWQLLKQQGQTPPQGEFERLSASLEAAFGPEPEYRSPLPVTPPSLAGDEAAAVRYLLADEGRQGLVLLQLAEADHQFAAGTAAIDRLREVLAELRATLPADVELGLTGLPIMENDEMRASQTTMNAATGLSLIGVALLFWAAFGGFRLMFMSIFTLIAGTIWTFAFATGAVGHLNILSISFTVILVGLGIDFSIHYCAKYLEFRTAGLTLNQAISATAGTVGPGVVTGCVTTAAAFYVASFTEFTGLAELGLIAGGGILLCGLGTLFLLPVMLRLCEPKVQNLRFQPIPLGTWMNPLWKRPWKVILGGLAITATCGLGIPCLRYDHNLLNLQPVGLESVVWEQRLLNEGKQSVWYALSIANSAEAARALKTQFEALPSVARVEELASLVPVDEQSKTPLITQIGKRVERLVPQPPLIPVCSPEQLVGMLQQLELLFSADPATAALATRCAALRTRVGQLPLADFYGRCARFQHQLADEVWQRLNRLQRAAEPVPPQLSDMAPAITERFVGKQGKYLVKVYAQANIWDMPALSQFVQEVRTVDPIATGKPLQTFEASRQMLGCYQQAAVYALAVIFVLLWLDFRNLKHTLLALLPLALGVVQLFGLLGLLDMPINPANVIVLPLILGIGVDDGVHIMHDFRQARGRYRLSDATANSVMLTSLTTMVGFGSLMIADHRGIESLGCVMVLGSFTCLLSSLFVLPALLSWLTRHRAPAPQAEAVVLPAPVEQPRLPELTAVPA